LNGENVQDGEYSTDAVLSPLLNDGLAGKECQTSLSYTRHLRLYIESQAQTLKNAITGVWISGNGHGAPKSVVI
jgi:hypothetical protein